MDLGYIPQNYNRIGVVNDLTSLFGAAFNPANVILHPRRLSGDFNALAGILGAAQEKQPRPNPRLCLEALITDSNTPVPVATAALAIIQDMDEVMKTGARPDLRILNAGNRNYQDGHYYFHEDNIGSNKEALERGVILCCYTDPVTEYLRNEDAGPRFNHIFYDAVAGGQILRFHAGDIWRHAGTKISGGPDVPAFIHRAPKEMPNGIYRLVLMGI